MLKSISGTEYSTENDDTVVSELKIKGLKGIYGKTCL